uniref:Ovomucoid n=1 Tax=Dromaius novaehollandiae TaxID=8790 RepID=A0A8C4P4Z0_DRONO
MPYASLYPRKQNCVQRNGKLTCTRENDPVRDSSGKQHSNKCIMCDNCREYRSQFEASGRLSCTRENDPVRDSSGKRHPNKCLMCAEKL